VDEERDELAGVDVDGTGTEAETETDVDVDADAADVDDVAVAFWFISCCGWRGGLLVLLVPLPLPLPDALRLTCVLSVVKTAGVTSGNDDDVAAVVEETAARCKI